MGLKSNFNRRKSGRRGGKWPFALSFCGFDKGRRWTKDVPILYRKGPHSSVFPGPATVDTVDGRYEIGVVRGGGYNVSVQSEGYRFGSTITLRPRLAQRLRADVELALAATISGRVVDDQGAPVVGAVVQRHPVTTDTTTTDADGRFTISTAPGWVHWVSAHHGNLVGTTKVGLVPA
jgi:hypothetical protein